MLQCRWLVQLSVIVLFLATRVLREEGLGCFLFAQMVPGQ